MLGEQGGNSKWGKSRGDKEKKKNEEKIEGAKYIFLGLPQKQKQNQIDLGWNKLT